MIPGVNELLGLFQSLLGPIWDIVGGVIEAVLGLFSF